MFQKLRSDDYLAQRPAACNGGSLPIIQYSGEEMTIWLKDRLPGARGPFLDRLLLWSGALLVLAVAIFGIFYALDQGDGGGQGGGGGGELVRREIARYEEAIRANPDDVATRIALAQLYYADQRYRESVKQYQAAIALNGETTAILVGLGRALLDAGDTEGAIGSFQKVIEISQSAEVSPDLLVEAAHYYLGSIYLDRRQPAEAIVHLKEAVAIERTEADAWHLLGAAYLANGNLDQAINALSQAILFVPDFAEAYENLALAYERKGLAPESRYARGMLAYAQGRYSEAEAELKAAIGALQGSSVLADAYVGLGLARESQGQRDAASAAYQQALQADPNSFNAREGLIRLNALPSPGPGGSHGGSQ